MKLESVENVAKYFGGEEEKHRKHERVRVNENFIHENVCSIAKLLGEKGYTNSSCRLDSTENSKLIHTQNLSTCSHPRPPDVIEKMNQFLCGA